MKRFFIFGALPPGVMPVKPRREDFIIAADRGLEHLEKMNIVPDIIIGDFDSLGRKPLGDNVISLPVMKDDTDTGKAIEYALKNGAQTIYLYGVIGGKTDHTTANLQLSAGLSRKNVKGYFFGDGYAVTSVTNGKISIPPKNNGRLSVFAFGGDAHGVSIKGALYELQNAVLSPFYPLGVSNSFIGREVDIEVKDGTLTVMWEIS